MFASCRVRPLDPRFRVRVLAWGAASGGEWPPRPSLWSAAPALAGPWAARWNRRQAGTCGRSSSACWMRSSSSCLARGPKWHEGPLHTRIVPDGSIYYSKTTQHEDSHPLILIRAVALERGRRESGKHHRSGTSGGGGIHSRVSDRQSETGCGRCGSRRTGSPVSNDRGGRSEPGFPPGWLMARGGCSSSVEVDAWARGGVDYD